ncbi:hypothetical protein ACQEU3_27790 [Spirillospora sp. CA-253888]
MLETAGHGPAHARTAAPPRRTDRGALHGAGGRRARVGRRTRRRGPPRGGRRPAAGPPRPRALDARSHDRGHLARPCPAGAGAGRGLRCDLSRGASGGPWLTGFDPATGRGAITSISSFRFADDQATLYGPPFGPSVRHAYEQAQHA